MIIVQISDTHIASEGQKTYGVAPMVRNLERCIDHINQLIPKPDLVLVTGDITNEGSMAETQQAATVLSKLNCPFYITAGNHDDRAALRAVFEPNHCAPNDCMSAENNFINFVINDHDIRLISLDSTTPRRSGGSFCQQRADWLDVILAQDQQKPTILFMHHPPLKMGILETDKDGFEGADLLGGIIQKYDNIERIMCGHVHLAFQSRWRGTLVSTAPSMGMQLVFDLSLEQPSRFVLNEPSFQLHHWTTDKNLVTQTITVREKKQAFLFEHYEDVDTHQHVHY